MATQSGILTFRPAASRGVVTSTIPANTPVEECYKLVNEETADDDATYISLSGGSDITFLMLPESNVNILSFDPYSLTEYARAKKTAGSGTSSGYFSNYVDWDNGDSRLFVFDALNDLGSTTGNWLSQKSKPLQGSVEETFLPLLQNKKLAIRIGDSSTQTKITIDISQIYLEIQCDYEIIDEPQPTSPIYLKQNGVWLPLSGALYQKQNGVWVGIGADELSLDSTYTIVQKM